MHPLEQEILNKIRLGEKNAFEYLFRSYYSLLCNYAFELTKSEESAKEVVQEILIKVWENRESLNITTSIKSYLMRSVHNSSLNLLKHQQTLKNYQDKYEEDALANVEFIQISEEEYTLDDYLYDGLEKDFNEAILTLPDQCRVIFKMSRLDHLKHEEISKSLNLSVNTVKTQIKRALEKLRSVISAKMNENRNKPFNVL